MTEKTAKKWLAEFLNEKFEQKTDEAPQCTNFYIGNKWLFQKDEKNKILWFSMQEIFKPLAKNYNLTSVEIHELVGDAVKKQFKCTDYIIYGWKSI